MGWRSWNFMKQNVSQEKILAQVDAIVARRNGNPSLLDVGYSHIGIDDGWQKCGAGINNSFHDKAGKPIINTSRFPDMKEMNAQAHALGVKMGWYANNCGCNEAKQFGNIGGHVLQDVQATLDLGFDGLKVDGCGPSQNISVWTDLINKSGHPVLLEDCLTKRYTRRGLPAPIPLDKVFEECPGNFFRLGPDIAPQFYSTMFNLIFTFNVMAPYQNLTHPVSRPGCWVYHDMLEVGNDLTLTESRTHFAAWAVTSSPLVLGFDLADNATYDKLYPIIASKRALSVSQQWAGHPGLLVANSTQYFDAPTAHGASGKISPKHGNVTYPTWQVWRKPLADPKGGQAVLVINLSEEPQDVSFAYEDIDPSLGSSPSATDVWTGGAVPVARSSASFKDIASHDSVFIILAPRN
jgi:alpha-galactosidase